MNKKIRKILCLLISISQFLEFAFPIKIYSKQSEIKKSIDSTKKEIAKINKQSNQNKNEQKNLTEKITKISSELEMLDKNMQNLKEQNFKVQEQIDPLVSQMEQLNNQLASIGVHINSLSEKEKRLKNTVQYALYNDYTSSTNIMEIILSSKNFAQCAANLEYTKMFTNHGNDTINRYNETVKELTEQKNSKIKTLAELQINEKNLNSNITSNINQLDNMTELKAKANANLEELKILLSKTNLQSKNLENSRKIYETMKQKLEKQNSEKENIEKTIASATANTPAPNTPTTTTNIASQTTANNYSVTNKAPDSTKKNYKKDETATPALKSQVSSQNYIKPLNGKYYCSRGMSGRHKGVDLACGKISVVASRDGEVVVAGNNQKGFNGYGNVIVVQHGGGYCTLYAHLSKINVKVGQKVKQGEVIGTAGCTGNSSGVHLHFEIRYKGCAVNPERYVKVR